MSVSEGVPIRRRTAEAALTLLSRTANPLESPIVVSIVCFDTKTDVFCFLETKNETKQVPRTLRSHNIHRRKMSSSPRGKRKSKASTSHQCCSGVLRVIDWVAVRLERATTDQKVTCHFLAFFSLFSHQTSNTVTQKECNCNQISSLHNKYVLM